MEFKYPPPPLSKPWISPWCYSQVWKLRLITYPGPSVGVTLRYGSATTSNPNVQSFGQGTERDSYQGYAITAGNFLISSREDFAVSVPKFGTYFGVVRKVIMLCRTGELQQKHSNACSSDETTPTQGMLWIPNPLPLHQQNESLGYETNHTIEGDVFT